MKEPSLSARVALYRLKDSARPDQYPELVKLSLAVDDLNDVNRRLAESLGLLVDDEPCDYDQNGYCMAHFNDHMLDGCRVAEARALLRKLGAT